MDRGIPVMGHLGLTPQSVHALGGYRVQGRGEAAAVRLVEDARAVEAAGELKVLVLYDMLGLNEAFRPRFLKRYAELAEEVRRAARAFTDDVKAGRYPGDEHGFE